MSFSSVPITLLLIATSVPLQMLPDLLGEPVERVAGDGVLVLRDSDNQELCGVSNNELVVRQINCEGVRVADPDDGRRTLAGLGAEVAAERVFLGHGHARADRQVRALQERRPGPDLRPDPHDEEVFQDDADEHGPDREQARALFDRMAL